MRLLWKLLAVFVMLGLFPAYSRALIHLTPIVAYQTFYRSAPENAQSSRLGGGLLASIDLGTDAVALEASGMVFQEALAFQTGNTFSETTYMGRAGLLYRLVRAGPLQIGARGGAQYDRRNASYHILLSTQDTAINSQEWTGYAGGQLEIIPTGIFGIRLAATVFYDRLNSSWTPEYSAGIVFHVP